MKIEKIIVRNFRLLKDFSIDLEDSLSLVIGKNNVGKTSLLLILDQFIGPRGEGGRNFRFNDLNLDAQEQLKVYMTNPLMAEEAYSPIAISMRLLLSYTDMDNLANVSPLLMDLDVDNHFIAVGFDYYLPFEGYKELRSQCAAQKAKFDAKHPVDNANADEGVEGKARPEYDVMAFLSDNAISKFKLVRKSVKVDKDGVLDESDYVDLADIPNFKMESVIQFQSIGARRDVDNRDVDKTLSSKTSDLYKAIEENQEQIEAKENFLEQL